MKLRLTIIFFSAILLVFINSCTKEQPVEPPSTPPETIIADNTAQVDSNSFKTGLVSIDSAQIIYSSSNSFTQSLVVGGFIVSDYGEGLLRKIESIQTQGSQVVIGTRHARLDEVILKGTIDFRGTLSPEGMILEGSSNENVFLNKENGEITITFPHISFGVNDLDINSETSFDPPEFIFHVELNFGIKSFEAGVVVSNVSFLEVNTTGQVNVNSNYSPPWAQIKFLPGIPTPIPLLRIVPIIKVVLGGEVRIEVVSENRIEASTTITGGVTYENETWDNYSTLSQQFDFNSNIVGANAFAKMGLSIPRVGFYFNSLAGAFIELELYGKFKVANDNQGWYRGVYAGLGGKAGVEASILGFSIQSPLIDIFQNEWELNKDYFGENTPPEAVFSISPSTGNTNTIFDFDASGSTDNEDPVSALEVRWDWESDGVWDTPYSTTKTETHQYLVSAEYTVKLQVLDSDGLTDIASSILNVSSVGGNQPPNEPSNPSPSNGATNQSINVDLSWTCSDPENDPLTYDIYFGTESEPPLVQPNHPVTNYNPGTLVYSTRYNWKIVAKDDHSNSTTGQIWNFTTESEVGMGEPCPGIPTITYEGKTYNTVQIGSQCWLKENLDVGTMIQGHLYQNSTDNGIVEKYCYNDNPNNCTIYGGLYQWDEAMQYVNIEGAQGICPVGWHIPKLTEYETLAAAVNYDGIALNAIGQGGTNISGFSALMSGYYGFSTFGGLDDRNHFWSSSEYRDGFAYDMRLFRNFSLIAFSIFDDRYGFSVRCLKD